MIYKILEEKISNKPYWDTAKITILDESDNDKEILKFDRNYGSQYGNTTFFTFIHNGKTYALIGRKYNQIQCSPFGEWDKIITVKDWSVHDCPLNYRQINNNLILVNSIIWGDSGSYLSILDISNLENDIIVRKDIEYPIDLDVYNFDEIEINQNEDGITLDIPLRWSGWLKIK